MNLKNRKLLFELTRNLRITTKEIGRKTKTTQQSSSYTINQFKKKKIIQHPTTIVDAVKLGFTNVLVGFNYKNFDIQAKRDILEKLKDNNMIISIEESKQGVDLLVEYSAPNLSAFNKQHTELMYKLKSLETKFIFPVIVRHKYVKNYLVKKLDKKDLVLSGDRALHNLTKKELKVLKALINNPDGKIVSIAKTTNIPVKTIVKIKKDLEKRAIIKGYSCVLNNKKVGINRYILFIKFTSEGINEIKKVVEFAKYNKNIIELTKIIGDYHILLIVEELQETNIINDLRSKFSIEDYFLIKSETIHKKKYLPEI